MRIPTAYCASTSLVASGTFLATPQRQLDQVAMRLNQRPREICSSFQTPAQTLFQSVRHDPSKCTLSYDPSRAHSSAPRSRQTHPTLLAVTPSRTHFLIPKATPDGAINTAERLATPP